jgi:molybdate transport system permease protein
MWHLTSDESDVILLSLKVALWCVAGNLIPGIFFGWVLAKKNFWGKSFLDAIVYLPLVLPPVVLGYLLLVMFGHHGLIGNWLYQTFGISIAFNWKGAVIASAVMSFPLIVQPVRLAIALVDKRLEMVGRTLGAGPFRVFFTITLPLALPGVLAGIILVFSRSLGEFGATITFVGNIAGQTRTLPLLIYTYIHVPNGDAAAFRLIVLSLLLAFFSLLASNFLTRYMSQRLGHSTHA